MLLEKLRADQIAARKARDTLAANLLTTLVSEAAIVGKNDGNRVSTDEEVTATVRKFIKNAELLLTEVRKSQNPDATAIANGEREISILSGYMPQQMSEDDLRGVVETFKAGKPDAKMGDVMAHLKANHGGLYDGKLASQVTKQVLG